MYFYSISAKVFSQKKGNSKNIEEVGRGKLILHKIS